MSNIDFGNEKPGGAFGSVGLNGACNFHDPEITSPCRLGQVTPAVNDAGEPARNACGADSGRPSSVVPTDPHDITFAWVRDFKDEVLALPKHVLTSTEKGVILTLADRIKVRQVNKPPPPGCGTWAMSFKDLEKRAGCKLRSTKYAIRKARDLGIVRQLWRGNNGYGDPHKAKKSGYTLERPTIAAELDPVAWENACAPPTRNPRRAKEVREYFALREMEQEAAVKDQSHNANGNSEKEEDFALRENEARSAKNALRDEVSKCRPAPSRSADRCTLNNHITPVGPEPTGRANAPPAVTVPPESVVADSLSFRCEKESPQDPDSRSASSSIDSFPGSSASESGARSEPRTVDMHGDHPVASSHAPSPEDWIIPDDLDLDEEEDLPAEIWDAASDAEDSPLVPIVEDVELPFPKRLDLAVAFRALDRSGLAGEALFDRKAALTRDAVHAEFGPDSMEFCWHWCDALRDAQRLADALHDDPPPLSPDDLERLPASFVEDLEP